MKDSHKRFILPLMCVLLLAGCATTRSPSQSEAETDPIDPYENLNRKSYDLTDVLDRKILEPIANVYMDYVPLRMQRSIGYFYDNLEYPNVVLNDFLQGKVSQGFGDALRFLINSTVGVAGLFDVASPMGYPQHDEDFGQTLGVWGVDATTYIFIPFLGPSSNRDAPGIPVAFGTHVLFYVGTFVIGAPVTVPLSALGVIQKRARLSGPMRIRDEAALEPYLFVRDSYLQQRKHVIYDGNPPPESYDDFQEDEPPILPKK
jgi:phospholipid-binding lipoprotein MlaA